MSTFTENYSCSMSAEDKCRVIFAWNGHIYVDVEDGETGEEAGVQLSHRSVVRLAAAITKHLKENMSNE